MDLYIKSTTGKLSLFSRSIRTGYRVKELLWEAQTNKNNYYIEEVVWQVTDLADGKTLLTGTYKGQLTDYKGIARYRAWVPTGKSLRFEVRFLETGPDGQKRSSNYGAYEFTS